MGRLGRLEVMRSEIEERSGVLPVRAGRAELPLVRLERPGRAGRAELLPVRPGRAGRAEAPPLRPGRAGRAEAPPVKPERPGRVDTTGRPASCLFLMPAALAAALRLSSTSPTILPATLAPGSFEALSVKLAAVRT